jgi:gamma-glutamyl phosphate reductase
MQTLSADKRSKIIKDYAHSLLQNASLIAEANKVDLDLAKKNSKLKFLLESKKKLLI